MRSLSVIAAVSQVASGGGSQVAVRSPFLNPAGVTYLSGPAPAGLAAGPALGYAAGPASAAPGYGFAAAHGPAFGYAAAPASAAPAVAAAPASSYAAAPAVAAVPTVHHSPAEAHVPVTRVEAQPGVVSKSVDVAHPAVSTRRFEIRRPAIQKQFYDIEERVVIRPAGSALVELDQPSSKTQRGPAVVNPVAHGSPVAAAPGSPIAAPASPVAAAPIAVTPAPIAVTPAPPASFGPGSFGPAPTPGPVAFDDSDSSAIDNPDFARAAPSPAPGPAPSPYPAPRNEAQARGLPPPPPPTAAAYPSVEVRGAGAPSPSAAPAPPVAAPAAVVPSSRSLDPNVNQANQQRLIASLTERGGVAEVGFGRAGPAAAPVGDAGPVRARVLSATPAPPLAAPAGERVNTRRVVVSRPIETVQEVDVVEPVTKSQRLAVHQPTVFKTSRQDIARVPTSVPVSGKASAPVAAPLAHASPYGAAPGLPFAGGYSH